MDEKYVKETSFPCHWKTLLIFWLKKPYDYGGMGYSQSNTIKAIYYLYKPIRRVFF